MAKSITMSFSVPLELSIKMEECMENTGFNRSELIKSALINYLESQEESKKSIQKIEETHEMMLEIKEILDKLTK